MNRGNFFCPSFYSVPFLSSPFFHCSHGVVVLLVLCFLSLGSQVWRLLQPSTVGIWNQPSAPRACILRYLKMAHCANQREPRSFFFGCKRLRMPARRRQYSSSVHTFVHCCWSPALSWEPEWGPLLPAPFFICATWTSGSRQMECAAFNWVLKQVGRGLAQGGGGGRAHDTRRVGANRWSVEVFRG